MSISLRYPTLYYETSTNTHICPRWVMYNHRILSFIAFTCLFWFINLTFAGLAWLFLSSYFHTPELHQVIKADNGAINTDVIGTPAGIKTEDEESESEPDLSDTPRSFPTYGRQPTLRYSPTI